MRRPCYAHASQDAAVGARAGETVAPVQHSSPGDHISCASAVGRTRSATGHATGMKLLLLETSRLRDEVERLRAVEQEARYLSASIDQIMKSRDQWRREAERVRAMIA
jgi:hypothetical protein